MKTKLKKIAYNIIKTIWLIIGGLLILWTGFWFVKMYTIQDLGVIAIAVLFASGIYLIMIYLAITLLFLLIKWVIKKIRK